jgi:hypothetical protein
MLPYKLRYCVTFGPLGTWRVMDRKLNCRVETFVSRSKARAEAKRLNEETRTVEAIEKQQALL